MDSAHLEDAVGVIGNRSVGIHREDESGGGEQSETGQRDAVELQRGRFAEDHDRADNHDDDDHQAPRPTIPGLRRDPTESALPGRCAPRWRSR